MSAPTKCKTCGKSIVFASIVKSDGTPGHIPLDMAAPCYRIVKVSETGEGVTLSTTVAVRDQLAHVSHFATCNDPSSHSKKAKTNG